ncbi:MAG: hypothetical protein Q4A21_03485 [bacterium]|nr:hypothetical protein [bacterium]
MKRTFTQKIGILLMILMLAIGIFNFSPITHALDGAKWTDNSKSAIFYDGKNFKKASASEKAKLPENLRNGEVFIEDVGISQGEQTARVITLDKIEDKINGKISTIKVSALGNASQQGNSQNITGQGVASDAEQGKTSCAVEGGGGWIICMIGNTLARGMDALYGFVENFLKVQPLQTSDRSGVFIVWNYMKDIANIVLAIIMIAVVYSQITNVGVSNYGIKKILPKLIIAAILINLSYYISAILVDISNISGHQVQNMLVDIRKNIFESGLSESGEKINVQGLSGLSWATLMTGLLSGAGYAGYSLAIAGATNILGVGILVSLVLLGLIYSAFVAFMVLAARQAIITVLIFLSPLAFAASILPNTEKWFEKWKDLLTTMLLMYPLIALVFGGSQLVGLTIIANANGNLATLILGMAVQVIPLAITPTIMKVSGSLLGKFAGIINNPNKGPVDSARNWIKGHQEANINRQIAKGGKFNPTAAAHGMRYRRNARWASNKNIAEQYQKARFQESEIAKHEKATKMSPSIFKDFMLSRSIIQNELDAQQNLDRASANYSAKISEIKADIIKGTLKLDDKGVVVGVDESKLKEMSRKYGKKAVDFLHNTNEANAYKEAERNNNLATNSAIANHLKNNEDLLKKASGIRGEEGRVSALASAMAAASKESKEEIESVSKLMSSLDFSGKDYQSVMDKNQGEDIEKNGIKLKVNDNLRKAAAERFMQTADISDIIHTLGKTTDGGELSSVRASLVEAFKKNKKDDVQFMGAGFLDELALSGKSEAEIMKHIATKFSTEFSSEKASKMADSAMKLLFNYSGSDNGSPIGKESDIIKKAEIQKAINEVFAKNSIKITEGLNELNNADELKRKMSKKQKEQIESFRTTYKF